MSFNTKEGSLKRRPPTVDNNSNIHTTKRKVQNDTTGHVRPKIDISRNDPPLSRHSLRLSDVLIFTCVTVIKTV